MPGFLKSCFSDASNASTQEKSLDGSVSDQSKLFANKSLVDFRHIKTRQSSFESKDGSVQIGKDEAYYNEYEKQEHQNQIGIVESEMEPGRVNLAMEYTDDIARLESSASESSDEEELAVEYKKGTLRLPKPPIRFLIIDCSPINFIDTVGVKTMKQLISDFNEIGVRVFLAECNGKFRARFKAMENSAFQGRKSRYLDDNIVYVSIHDAVLSAERVLARKSRKEMAF